MSRPVYINLSQRTVPIKATDTANGRICSDGIKCEKKPQPLEKFPRYGAGRASVCLLCKSEKQRLKRLEKRRDDPFFNY